MATTNTAPNMNHEPALALMARTLVLAVAVIGFQHGAWDLGDRPGRAPPQPDLVLDGGYFHDGVFSQADFEVLHNSACPGVDEFRQRPACWPDERVLAVIS